VAVRLQSSLLFLTALAMLRALLLLSLELDLVGLLLDVVDLVLALVPLGFAPIWGIACVFAAL
jgi:hypothetical protein